MERQHVELVRRTVGMGWPQGGVQDRPAMTRRPRPDRDELAPPDSIDFSAPRWRGADGQDSLRPGKSRRFRNDSAPEQAGALDAEDSVPRGTDPPDPSEAPRRT
jgi:hypothetical protein